MIAQLNLKKDSDIKESFELMRQLRSHLNFETYQTYLAQMLLEQYELWAYRNETKILGLMSLRIYTDLVRGPHLYIDDLVTDEKHRSSGIGSKLLQKAETIAHERGLSILRLSCVLENTEGLKFYKKNSWFERAFIMQKKISL